MTIPLMLLSLGAALAKLEIRNFGRSLVLALLRLGLGLAIALILAEILDLGPIARGVLIVQAAMPSAVYNYLFAERFKRSPNEIASVIVLSTLISFLTLPLLLLIAL